MSIVRKRKVDACPVGKSMLREGSRDGSRPRGCVAICKDGDGVVSSPCFRAVLGYRYCGKWLLIRMSCMKNTAWAIR